MPSEERAEAALDWSEGSRVDQIDLKEAAAEEAAASMSSPLALASEVASEAADSAADWIEGARFEMTDEASSLALLAAVLSETAELAAEAIEGPRLVRVARSLVICEARSFWA